MYSVLLVDDCHADVIGLIENINWNTLGCKVSGTAYNGYEGIKLALELKPDIIITDVSMPVMDGIEKTKEIRTRLPDVNIIFISCFDEFKYIKRAMDENATAYVLKPIELDELTNAILKVTSSLEKNQKNQNYLRRHISTLTENFISDLLLNSDYDTEYASLLSIPCNDNFRIAIFQFDSSNKDSAQIYSNVTHLKQKLLDLCEPSSTFVLEIGIDSLVFLSSSTATSEEPCLFFSIFSRRTDRHLCSI